MMMMMMVMMMVMMMMMVVLMGEEATKIMLVVASMMMMMMMMMMMVNAGGDDGVNDDAPARVQKSPLIPTDAKITATVMRLVVSMASLLTIAMVMKTTIWRSPHRAK